MDESAGKRRSTKIRKGNPWLKTTLIQCAWAAIRSPGYMRSKYHRLRGRQDEGDRRRDLGETSACNATPSA
jgi:transposase